jgi:hypothetical protein
MPAAEIGLFKQIVQSGHPKAAAEFWSEHFIFSLLPIAQTPGETAFQQMLRNDCREMVQWLKSTFGAKFPTDQKAASPNPDYYSRIAEDVLARIIAETVRTYQMELAFLGRKAAYRAAASHALDDPDKDWFSSEFEKGDHPPEIP